MSWVLFIQLLVLLIVGTLLTGAIVSMLITLRARPLKGDTGALGMPGPQGPPGMCKGECCRGFR